MFSFLRSKLPVIEALPLSVDIHSHLLPGIDDGAATMDEAVAMIRAFEQMGFKKLITTPHIMSDFYKNTPEIISEKLSKVREVLEKEGISILIEAAAEYYLDEGLIRKLKKEEPLLTFGDHYLLFETSYMNPSSYLHQAIFMMLSQGYKPVLAHPERYVYWFNDYQEILRTKEKGVLLQVNINSLTGYYSTASQKIAQQLIDDKAISFIGSDCHKPKHLDTYKAATQTLHYKKATHLPLLNHGL